MGTPTNSKHSVARPSAAARNRRHLGDGKPIHRALVIFALIILTAFANARAEQKRSMILNGMHCCVKHRKPLISVPGFQSSSNPLVLVHAADPRSAVCDGRAPNRIADDQHLARSKIHVEPHSVTYCPRCAAEYWQCMGRDPVLSTKDIQQITEVLLERADFRQPIIRIIPFSKARALVIGGRENQVGDRFSDISVSKRVGKWVVSFPGELHKVEALGRGP